MGRERERERARGGGEREKKSYFGDINGQVLLFNKEHHKKKWTSKARFHPSGPCEVAVARDMQMSAQDLASVLAYGCRRLVDEELRPGTAQAGDLAGTGKLVITSRPRRLRNSKNQNRLGIRLLMDVFFGVGTAAMSQHMQGQCVAKAAKGTVPAPGADLNDWISCC